MCVYLCVKQRAEEHSQMIKQIQQNVKIHEYGEEYMGVLCSTLILATSLYVLNYFCIKVNNHTHTQENLMREKLKEAKRTNHLILNLLPGRKPVLT